MGLYRALYENGEDEDGQAPDPARLTLDEWLDACQNEYDVLVARLRFLDKVLVKYRRKRSYLLPRKVDR